ncbi:hypothetical protein EJB05_40440, partial [Eragrostis curvula]
MGAAWRITLWRPVLCVPNGGARKAGGTYKLEEAVEKPCCDLLAAHLRKCACAWPAWHNGDLSPPSNRGRNHNSWGNVYNLCRVKTVMTAVLTVKSGMDPHTISWEWLDG